MPATHRSARSQILGGGTWGIIQIFHKKFRLIKKKSKNILKKTRLLEKKTLQEKVAFLSKIRFFKKILKIFMFNLQICLSTDMVEGGVEDQI